MSALGGIFNLDAAPIPPHELQWLVQAMAHRGPHASSLWHQSGIGLCHALLRATPESSEEQAPVFARDGKLILIWDGRLDRRAHLIQKLAPLAHKNMDDATLAALAWARWGAAAPAQLEGDFAFAVWESEARRLTLVRDRMGGRALYYAQRSERFMFASEEEALLVLPDVEARPNTELLAYWFEEAFFEFDGTQGLIADIKLLGAGEMLCVSPEGLRRQVYWTLQVGEPQDYPSLQESQEAFLEVFSVATSDRLRLSGAPALMLSGGLDSAAVGAMLVRQTAGHVEARLHTYSAVAADAGEAETRCINSMVGSFAAIACRRVIPDGKSKHETAQDRATVQEMLDLAWSKPHPVDNDILIPMLMAREASLRGHRAIFAGIAGDLVFHVPTQYPAWWLQAGHWGAAWRESHAASRNHNFLAGQPPGEIFARSVWSVFGPRWIKRLRRLRRHMVSPGRLLHPDLVRQLNLTERLQQFEERQWRAGMGDLQQRHLAGMTGIHGIANGMVGGGQACARFGLELRDPIGDWRVAEFFLRLPLQYKVQDGWTKFLVRTSFARELEDEVRWRVGKEHLGWSLIQLILANSQDRLEQTMTHDLNRLEGVLDTDYLRNIWRRHGLVRNARLWYDVLVLIEWLKRIESDKSRRREGAHKQDG